jgi:hypothetical protein
MSEADVTIAWIDMALFLQKYLEYKGFWSRKTGKSLQCKTVL